MIQITPPTFPYSLIVYKCFNGFITLFVHKLMFVFEGLPINNNLLIKLNVSMSDISDPTSCLVCKRTEVTSIFTSIFICFSIILSMNNDVHPSLLSVFIPFLLYLAHTHLSIVGAVHSGRDTDSQRTCRHWNLLFSSPLFPSSSSMSHLFPPLLLPPFSFSSSLFCSRCCLNCFIPYVSIFYISFLPHLNWYTVCVSIVYHSLYFTFFAKYISFLFSFIYSVSP